MTVASPPRRALARALLLALPLWMAGCLVGSLQPLFRPGEALPAPELLGRWTDTDALATWHFTAGEGGTYTLVYNEESGAPQRFEATVGAIGGARFLQLTPKEPISDHPLMMASIRPLYTFARMGASEGEISLAFLSQSWVGVSVAPRDYYAPQQGQQSSLVLFLSTEALKDLAAQAVAAPDAFDAPITLRRAP